jgi:nucleoid DNA-binding protein
MKAATLTKREFVNDVAATAELDPQVVNAVLDALSAVVADELAGGTPVTVPGLVRMRPRFAPAKPKRKGTNPRTGEEVVFAARAARLQLKATPARAIRDALPGVKSVAAQRLNKEQAARARKREAAARARVKGARKAA